MKYKDFMKDVINHKEKKIKKSIVKENKKIQPKKNSIVENLKSEINEWTHKPPTEKRWTKSFGGKNGLTEFENSGGKDTINETAPMGKMDKNKFMKYFDLALKTAGSSHGDIITVLRKMGLQGNPRELLVVGRVLADTVKTMTGEEL